MLFNINIKLGRLMRLEHKVNNVRGPGVTNTPNGISISPIVQAVRNIGGGPNTLRVKITGSIGAGRYNAKSFSGGTFEATGDLAESEFGTLAGSDDCIAIDDSQVGLTTARPLTDGIFDAEILPGSADGKRLVKIRSSVQGMRIKSDYTQIQVCYIGNPTSDDQWVDTMAGYECASEA
jgi:hypothetical protein